MIGTDMVSRWWWRMKKVKADDIEDYNDTNEAATRGRVDGREEKRRKIKKKVR